MADRDWTLPDESQTFYLAGDCRKPGWVLEIHFESENQQKRYIEFELDGAPYAEEPASPIRRKLKSQNIAGFSDMQAIVGCTKDLEASPLDAERKIYVSGYLVCKNRSGGFTRVNYKIKRIKRQYIDYGQ